MVELHLTVKGLSPLLMRNPAGSMEVKEEKIVSVGPRKFLSPKEEAERGLYCLDNGVLYVPAIALRASIIKGSVDQKVKIGNKQKAAGTVLRGALILTEVEHFVLSNGKGKPIKKYAIDTRRVVHGGTSRASVAIMRSRAKVELPWSLEASFYLEEALIGPEDIKKIANRAGLIAGLLDYRPNRGGTFGRYKVTHCKTTPI